MDDRLEKALSFSKYRVTIENRRKALQRRFESMIIVHENNGMFKSDPQTMAFVNLLISQGHNDAVLIDVKNNPIEINDLTALSDKLKDAYFAATNEYVVETKKLAKARNVRKAMDW